MAGGVGRNTSSRPGGPGSWDVWGVGPVHGASSHGRGWWQGEPLTAADVMSTNVVRVPRHMPLTQIAELMRRESVGVVSVVDADDCLVGVVTDRDIVVRGCVSSRPLDALTAADVMSADVECAKADETLVHIVERMTRRQVDRLPVLDPEHRRGPKVAGIITLDDLVAHATEDPELAEALVRRARRRQVEAQGHGRPAQATERPSFLPALWRRFRR
jgi:CBS domain-containing protein